MHHPDDLIGLFNDCFLQRYNTLLAYGDEEPLYLPAHQQQTQHMIFFAHGFFSSALHEVSHWLLAGKARRALVDYGYWYIPDGRDAEQQALFEQVEVKPQALEWVLSNAAGYRFQLSFDNLSGSAAGYERFATAVAQQRLMYEQQGLPPRAQCFYQALLGRYQRFKIAQPTGGNGMCGERILL